LCRDDVDNGVAGRSFEREHKILGSERLKTLFDPR
jgi:hypothetical protein